MIDTKRWLGFSTAVRMWRPLRAQVTLAICAALLGLSAWASGEDASAFKDHPYFKHLLGGSWKIDGELKAADGRVIKIKEEWKTQLLGDNTLTMEGSRELDGDSKNFKWTGLFEATHQADTSNPETVRFELDVPADGSKVEMSGSLGNGDAKLVIIDSYKDGDHDQIESQVSLKDASGTAVLSGTLLAKRDK